MKENQSTDLEPSNLSPAGPLRSWLCWWWKRTTEMWTAATAHGSGTVSCCPCTATVGAVQGTGGRAMRTPRFLLTGLAVAALSVACFGRVGHASAETYPPPPAWHPDVQQREHLRRSITLMHQSTPPEAQHGEDRILWAINHLGGVTALVERGFQVSSRHLPPCQPGD